jgi:hypothetical protein
MLDFSWVLRKSTCNFPHISRPLHQVQLTTTHILTNTTHLASSTTQSSQHPQFFCAEKPHSELTNNQHNNLLKHSSHKFCMCTYSSTSSSSSQHGKTTLGMKIMIYNTVTNQNAAEVLLWQTCLCHNHIRNSCNNSTTTPWIQPEHHYNPII